MPVAEPERFVQRLKLIADLNRLRLLALLGQEVSVAELANALELAQPRVSTHLAKLKDAALVNDRRVGVSAYYRISPDAEEFMRGMLAHLPESWRDADQQRLRAVIAQRNSSNWAEQVAGDMERHYSPGRTWEALSRAVTQLLELGDVLDVASGDGAVAEFLAPMTRSLTCVDSSARVIAAATQRLQRHPQVRLLQADMHALPLPAEAFDLVLMLQALPYARDLDPLLSEAARVMRPGAKLLGTGLLPHAHGDAVAPFGHVNHGVSLCEIERAAKAAGLTPLRVAHACTERRAPNFEISTFLLQKGLVQAEPQRT